MTTTTIPESHDLKNKPLVEALFEFRWDPELDIKSTSTFHLLMGRYYDRVRDDYPELEDLPPSQVPVSMTGGLVRHRFRVGPNEWPLTQIGPGILTVNETTKYKWEPFRERIEKSLGALLESHPSKKLEPIQIELRYINFIEHDFARGGITEFIQKNLHTTIKLDEMVTSGMEAISESALDFSLSIRLENPPGFGTLMFGTGESDGQKGILWQIILRSNKASIPKTYQDIIKWIDEAHGKVETWFFTLARGSLMDGFDKVPR
ncbi:TIGR04255 family protein [Paludisphaera mucosa]|uniref:TIGR04255 family protein n=1 Tax=Paludisphaera mucosa TaxID=3030827 RepID=A0ABT6FJC7_9BACT|nr:TIGR04255 family protein [Paludisphaera mucosa]MDG3007601.1 TIGR04255 family protein [Paludisphaera mucosa]